MTARKIPLFFVFLVVMGAVAVVWFARNRAPGKIRNVLLISIDTCRADYLGCYGFGLETTPNIDALAAQGVLFEHVVTPVPLTLPAHSSMLTGTIPPYHRVHDNLDYRLAEDNITLAELMKKAGYKTAAFVSAFVMDERFGIAQGFDIYDDDCQEQFEHALSEERNAEQTTAAACHWLEENKDEEFFLFVHYYDPHTPLIAPEPFASKYGTDPKAGYAAEIAYTDYHIGRWLDNLKILGLYDSSLIIITADHGEALGEHGESEHGYFIYDCSIRVPLIVKVPGRKLARRVKDIFGIVDIVPTICSLAKITEPPGVRGRDLTGYIKEKPKESERYLYCESLMACDFQCNPLLAVSTERWKYIQTTREELYDLQKDSGELNNLAGAESKRARMMEQQLKLILQQNVRTGTNENKMNLDDESRERLASLGYVGAGSANDTLEFDRNKFDPKDFIGFDVKRSSIERQIMKKELVQAQQGAKELVEEYPQIAYAHYLCGQVALRQEDWESALKYYSRAQELDPKSFRNYIGLGRASLGLGKASDAVKLLKRALGLNPDYFETYFSLGTACDQQGNFKEAVYYLEKAAQFQPNDEDIHFNLAIALSHLGELKRTVEHLQSAVELSPDRADIQLSLADNLNKSGSLNEAVVHYKKAIELDQGRPYTHNKLAEAHIKLGQLAEAVQQCKEALRLKPDWPYVLNNAAWLCATRPEADFYNPAESLGMARKACELTKYKEVSFMDTLAVAYAAMGRFEEAVTMAQKAIDLASVTGLENLKQQIRNRLLLYKAGQAYREPS